MEPMASKQNTEFATMRDELDMLDEKGEMTSSQIKKRGKMYDALIDKGMDSETAGRIATSKAMSESVNTKDLVETLITKLKH